MQATRLLLINIWRFAWVSFETPEDMNLLIINWCKSATGFGGGVGDPSRKP